jgi:hypothetical protein
MGRTAVKRYNFWNIKTSALTKRWGLRYCAYTHSLRLNLQIYLGPGKVEKFPKLSKLWKKQSKRALRLHVRACTCGQNPNSKEVSLGPWQHFSFWQLVSSLKNVVSSKGACNVDRQQYVYFNEWRITIPVYLPNQIKKKRPQVVV